jgi:hypothetical protein
MRMEAGEDGDRCQVERAADGENRAPRCAHERSDERNVFVDQFVELIEQRSYDEIACDGDDVDKTPGHGQLSLRNSKHPNIEFAVAKCPTGHHFFRKG